MNKYLKFMHLIIIDSFIYHKTICVPFTFKIAHMPIIDVKTKGGLC
jgi:hypothetical protein